MSRVAHWFWLNTNDAPCECYRQKPPNFDHLFNPKLGGIFEGQMRGGMYPIVNQAEDGIQYADILPPLEPRAGLQALVTRMAIDIINLKAKLRRYEK